MKVFKIILFLGICLFVIFFIASSIFIALKGKDIAAEALQKALNRKVTMGSIRLRLPFSIEVNDLFVEKLITARQVSLTPSLIGSFSGRVVLNSLKLKSPEIFIIRNADGSWNLPASKGGNEVIISNIVVEDARLNFTDYAINPAGFSLKLENTDLVVSGSLLSVAPLTIKFNANSDIICRQDKPAAKLVLAGWVNWFKKDMQGKINLSGLDAVNFSPYFEKYLPSPLESAEVFFTSDLNAKHNDLIAKNNLAVKNFKVVQKEGEKNPAISFLDIVTGGVKNEQQDVVLDFEIRTKLDRPRVDVAKLTGSVVAKSMGESMMRDPRGTIEKFKGLGKELESFGKDFLKKKAGEGDSE